MSVRVVIIALIASALIGCQAPVRPHLLEGFELSQSEVVELTDNLQQSAEKRSTIRSLWQSELSTPDGGLAARLVVVRCKPDRVRIELIPPQGVLSLAMLVGEGKGAQYLDREQKLFVVSADSAKVVEAFLRVQLSADDLAALLVGTLPQTITKKLEGGVLSDSGMIQLRSKNKQYLVTLDEKQLREVQIKHPFHDRLLLRVRYVQEEGSTLGTPRGIVPYSVFLEAPVAEMKLSLIAQGQAKTDFNCADSLFQVEAPADYQRIER